VASGVKHTVAEGLHSTPVSGSWSVGPPANLGLASNFRQHTWGGHASIRPNSRDDARAVGVAHGAVKLRLAHIVRQHKTIHGTD
jgi:hypothetical protein